LFNARKRSQESREANASNICATHGMQPAKTVSIQGFYPYISK